MSNSQRSWNAVTNRRVLGSLPVPAAILMDLFAPGGGDDKE